jgi:uncharacterized protein YbjT (DUF2867 family)
MAGDLILVSFPPRRCSRMVAHIFQITGVSGYIGFKILILALEGGFKVRAVIRKAEQAKKLESHGRVAPYTKNLQWILIPDLSETNSFDDHLKGGVSGIIHVASPLANEVNLCNAAHQTPTKLPLDR